MSGSRNLLAYGQPVADPDNPLTAGTPSLADAWSFNARTAQDWVDQQRAISAQRGLWDQGGMTPAGARDAGAQTANMLAMATTAPGFRAYHGSPHDFERFDSGRIGTGQGAQVYGHGLYVAENEGVARSYRDDLARKDYSTSTGGRVPDWIGTSIKQVGDQFGADSKLYGQIIDRHLGDFEARLADQHSELKTATDPWNVQDRITNLSGIVDSLKALRGGEATLLPRGRMYEVQVNADPAHFLDWDKPLSEQSPKVQEFFKNRGIAAGQQDAGRYGDSPGLHNTTGGDAYHRLVDSIGLAREGAAGTASETLQGAGIPGIRYLDGGSRAGGKGTSNHVIFDANTIEILRKYGIAGLMAGGTAAATLGNRGE